MIYNIFYQSAKSLHENNTFYQSSLATIKMVKFTVLKYHDLAVTKLVIYPFVKYFILLNLVAFVASSIMFVYQNISQFDVVLRALIFIFGTCQSIGMFYSYGTNLTKIQAVHFKLNEMFEKTIEGKICEWPQV